MNTIKRQTNPAYRISCFPSATKEFAWLLLKVLFDHIEKSYKLSLFLGKNVKILLPILVFDRIREKTRNK